MGMVRRVELPGSTSVRKLIRSLAVLALVVIFFGLNPAVAEQDGPSIVGGWKHSSGVAFYFYDDGSGDFFAERASGDRGAWSATRFRYQVQGLRGVLQWRFGRPEHLMISADGELMLIDATVYERMRPVVEEFDLKVP